jgi:hypothetical protein
MQLDEFIKKLILITLCIWLLLYLFFPKYQFIDCEHRVNILNGKSEHYSNRSWDRGWHE